MKKTAEIGTIIKGVLFIAIFIATICLTIDFFRFPMCYVTTWRYSLQTDIQREIPAAIEYYEENYLEKGRVLFEWYGK